MYVECRGVYLKVYVTLGEGGGMGKSLSTEGVIL